MVLNIDLAPTFAALAGAAAPGAEGRNLVPLLTTPSTPWRVDFLVEHHLTNLPSYCAVRWTKVHVRALRRRGAGGLDPARLIVLDSLALGDGPSQVSLVASMRARAVQLCNPPPPGYSFT